jgi:hypothetical protein
VDPIAVKNTSVCTATSMCAPGIDAVVDIVLRQLLWSSALQQSEGHRRWGRVHEPDVAPQQRWLPRIPANVTTIGVQVPLVVRDDVNKAATVYLYFLPIPAVVASSTVDVGLIRV